MTKKISVFIGQGTLKFEYGSELQDLSFIHVRSWLS